MPEAAHRAGPSATAGTLFFLSCAGILVVSAIGVALGLIVGIVLLCVVIVFLRRFVTRSIRSRLSKLPHTHTHTHTFNGPFSGTARVSRYQKVKPIWILLKQETVSGSGISWAICKSASRSRHITMPAHNHSVFYRPNTLPAAQPTVSKH